MKSLKKEDIEQEVFDLYDDYAHNKLQRREFIERLSLYAVGGITVASLMSFLMPNYKDTMLVPANDPRLDSLHLGILPLGELFSRGIIGIFTGFPMALLPATGMKPNTTALFWSPDSKQTMHFCPIKSVDRFPPG